MNDYNQLFQLNELAVKEAKRYPKKRAFYHRLVTEKGREQFKGITFQRKLILNHANVIEGIKRPLFLLGFT